MRDPDPPTNQASPLLIAQTAVASQGLFPRSTEIALNGSPSTSNGLLTKIFDDPALVKALDLLGMERTLTLAFAKTAVALPSLKFPGQAVAGKFCTSFMAVPIFGVKVVVRMDAKTKASAISVNLLSFSFMLTPQHPSHGGGGRLAEPRQLLLTVR